MKQHIEDQIRALKESQNIPRHIAIIMDGNGRWAKKRHLPRLSGHRAGRESVRTVVRTCAKMGVEYLTLYAFSLENWQRPKTEVRGLMSFFRQVLMQEYEELNANGVQLRAIGRIEMLPQATRSVLDRTIEKLKGNRKLILTLAISYGSRAEIVDVVKKIASKVKEGRLEPNEIDFNTFKQHLYDPELPDPDLLIRTSGEMRISNFLLWQIAYSEIYVTPVLWPDFREKDLIESIKAFQKRERRFGLIT